MSLSRLSVVPVSDPVPNSVDDIQHNLLHLSRKDFPVAWGGHDSRHPACLIDVCGRQQQQDWEHHDNQRDLNEDP